MSDFKDKAITTKGLELLSKAVTGGSLTFTRIEMGNGVQTSELIDVESLVNVKQNLQITSINRKGSQVTLSATLKLEDVKEEYDWTEIGVYAKGADNKEVLYLYGYTENSSFISPTSLNEKLIHITFMVSNTAEVTAIIDNSLIYLAKEDLETHDNDVESHKPLKEWVQGLFDSLKLTWGNITGKPSVFPAAPHGHSSDEITGLPSSLPANGGNADTVDGKHASDFATSTHTHNYAAASHTHNYLPNPSAGGVSEMGQYLDLHKSGSNADYDARISVNSSNQVIHTDANGTLAVNYEINNLKSTVISGKASVANAINGKLGTSLSNQTSFSDMAYYISSMTLGRIPVRADSQVTLYDNESSYSSNSIIWAISTTNRYEKLEIKNNGDYPVYIFNSTKLITLSPGGTATSVAMLYNPYKCMLTATNKVMGWNYIWGLS